MNEGMSTVVRRYRRSTIDVKVGLYYRNEFRFETGIQISEGGMLLAVRQPYQVGDALELCFFLPEGEMIEARAQVVYALDQESEQNLKIGLAFHVLPSNMQRWIRNYVANQFT